MLSDDELDAALQTDPAMILALMSGRMTVGEFKLVLRRLARATERAAYERAAQACYAERVEADLTGNKENCAYNMAIRHCAAAIRALGRQHD